ncbi:TonB-dependent siderophore receptor [uncultured Prevotella sp.]|uniref:TonB-dependent receptor plug domain-containing protein n=1 Tax=uncultured Prevotella sp. TaxID=159272 RepID=UPI0026031CA6|nr:TonB-dependent receptor [uncultured Prevotella sp.]
MKRITVFLLACSVSMLSNAQNVDNDTIDNSYQLQDIIITENKKKNEITSTAPLYIISNKSLNIAGITDIADALNRIPGITIRDYGGAGGMKTVSVRSFGTQHTGVSYDGIMLSDCQSGQIDLSRYSLENVDDISLVIGDNDDIFLPAKNASLPAIININTIKSPTNDLLPHLTSQLKIGSFGYISPFVRYEQNLSHSFALSAIGEFVYAENDYPFTLRNISVVTKERRTNSRMKSGHGEANFIWNINKHNQLDGKLYYYDNDRLLPGQVRYYTNLSNEKLRDQNFFAQLGYRTFNGNNLSFKFKAKYNWAASKYKDGSYSDGIKDADYWQREIYSSACILYTPFADWAFSYAADYSFNNMNSSLSTDTRPYRHTILQSATIKYKTSRISIIGKLLYSLYFNDAQYGKSAKNLRKLSPSLSMSYKIFNDKNIYVRASYKNIFRSPTFNESYFYHFGSTDLLPETTDQYNIGFTFLKNVSNNTSLKITLDGYMNHVKDKIVAVPYNMFIWTNVNIGKVKVLGFDATANLSYKFSDRHSLIFTTSYSIQSAKNRTNPDSPYYGYQIAYTPLHSGSVSLCYENPWVNVTLHGTGMSSRSANNEHYEDSNIPGFFDTGITLFRSFKVLKNEITLKGDIKNLFNKQYEIVKAYPMPGISYQFSINYKF